MMFPTLVVTLAVVLLAYTQASSLFSSGSGGGGNNNQVQQRSQDKDKQPAIYHHKRRGLLPTTAGDMLRMFDFWNDFSLYPQMTFANNMLVDIKEAKDHYEMHVDLPGVNKENVKITVSPQQNELQISAYREGMRHEEGQEYRLLERFTGNMTRTIYLPDSSDIDKVKATFNNGVLEINVPKVIKTEEECKTRSIDIQ